jgi:hypothetical protein
LDSARKHDHAQGLSNELVSVRLTKRNLPSAYRPVRNVGYVLCMSVLMLIFGLGFTVSAHQSIWRGFAFGLPMGVASSLVFVQVWMKNASHFLCLPPKGTSPRNFGEGLFRFYTEWRIPEARQTTLALVFASIPGGLFGYYFFLRPAMRPGGIPEFAPLVVETTSFFVIWAVGYLIWWRRLPDESGG